MATTVTLVGGPAGGTTVDVQDPWPRAYVVVLFGGLYYHYWVAEGTTTANYSDPLLIPPSEDPLAEGVAGPPGDPGVEGMPGPTGLTGAAGPVLTWMGAWDVSTVYGRYEAVSYSGSSYYMFNAASPAAGTLPTNTTYWALIALKGGVGAQGTTGATGATGATGMPGVAGTTGVQGAVGATGSPGMQGETGDAGGIGVVQEEGVDLAVRSKLNFIGAAVTATDDAGNDRTNVTVTATAGGGGGGSAVGTSVFDEDVFTVGSGGGTSEAQIWAGHVAMTYLTF